MLSYGWRVNGGARRPQRYFVSHSVKFALAPSPALARVTLIPVRGNITELPWDPHARRWDGMDLPVEGEERNRISSIQIPPVKLVLVAGVTRRRACGGQGPH